MVCIATSGCSRGRPPHFIYNIHTVFGGKRCRVRHTRDWRECVSHGDALLFYTYTCAKTSMTQGTRGACGCMSTDHALSRTAWTLDVFLDVQRHQPSTISSPPSSGSRRGVRPLAGMAQPRVAEASALLSHRRVALLFAAHGAQAQSLGVWWAKLDKSQTGSCLLSGHKI